MKRYGLVVVSLALLALSAAPVAADSGDGTATIMIMKHACTEADISSTSDFEGVESAGQGADNPVAGLVNTVLACPTTVLPGDEPSAGAIASDRRSFEFTVTDADGQTYTLADAEFVQAKLCESDVNLDADGNGEISAETCLDTSHYMFSGLASGDVTIEETSPPSGFRFGILRFTPSVINDNNDQDTLVGGLSDEPIELDTTADSDGMIMLHIYNFEAGVPATDTLGEPGQARDSAPIVPLAGLLLLVTATLGYLNRRLRRSP